MNTNQHTNIGTEIKLEIKRYFLLFVLAFFLTPSLFSQVTDLSSDEIVLYYRISIEEPSTTLLNTLSEMGIDLSCGAIFNQNSLQLELDNRSLLLLDKKEIAYSILIKDLTSYYAKKALEDLPKAKKELEALKEASIENDYQSVLEKISQNGNCSEVDWTVPLNFKLNPNTSSNTFGGCLTYTQILQELDDMRAQYPNLISQKLDASPSNQQTLEGRTLFYLRISDNPDMDEAGEPETLYQSLIHSREPSSVMQLLYFMWYLLENYDSDPDIKNLLNNQALYFIPIFNPDGFVYNEIQNPNGGGMQRKNRNLGTGACGAYLDGIDLNRNSAYYWGNGGSSTDECSNIYMGDAPFSENETQIMRDFFLQHDFKLALNHHSYKNAMLHAYAGTNITNPRPDEYSKYNHDMTYHNRYAYGPSTSISSLNSGNMNDWMLGGPPGVSSNGTPTGSGSGKNTLAWTPENGTSSEGGFWPLPSNFVIIAKRAMRMNFLAAYFSGKYAKLHDLNQSEISDLGGNLRFGIENLGQTPSDFTVTLSPTSSNIISVGNSATSSGLAILEQEAVDISYTLHPDIQAGDKIEFKVILSNDYASDNQLSEINIVKIYQPSVLFNDDPDNDGLSNWSSSGGVWELTSDAYSGSSAITSTLSQPYANNESKTLEMNTPLNFQNAEKVIIQYYAKWDLERSFDYVQLEASLDGFSWSPLCGQLTKPGAPEENNTYSNKSFSDNLFQPTDQPLYDGDTQGKWNKEEIIIDLESNSFLLNQPNVYLRFNFNTDGSNQQSAYYNANFEGFSFDDFKCILVEGTFVDVKEVNNTLFKVFPNPSKGQFTLELNDSKAESVRIYNTKGQEIFFATDIHTQASFHLNAPTGIYFMHLQMDNNIQIVKLVIR